MTASLCSKDVSGVQKQTETDISKTSLNLDGRRCSGRGGLSPPTLESILHFLFFCRGFRAGAHYILVLVAPPTTGRGFPDSSVSKESASNAGDPSLIPGSGRLTGEGIGYPLQYSWASLVAQLVKNQPAMWETWAQSLRWEDPLEKGNTTHSSILAWRILGSQRVGHD